MQACAQLGHRHNSSACAGYAPTPPPVHEDADDITVDMIGTERTLSAEFPAAALHFVNGDEIYSQPDANLFWEMTVAGTHPSSIGMQRFTSFWVPRLQTLLPSS